mgnify:CR=1 FL=1
MQASCQVPPAGESLEIRMLPGGRGRRLVGRWRFGGSVSNAVRKKFRCEYSRVRGRAT